MIKSIASPLHAPVAPGMLCVILDGSVDPGLQSHLDQAISYGVERYTALFAQTRYAGLQSAGPFAVLCPAPGALMQYALTLLERADAGCVAYLQNPEGFESAVEHWRSLLTVSTDETPARLMRFFDPRWLEPLLSSLDEPELQQFMGPVTDMAWRNELGWRHLANPLPVPSAEIQAPGWLHLSPRHQALMEQQRLKILARQFATQYQALVPQPEPVDWVYRQLHAARQAGYLQLATQERWLRLALTRGDGFWSRPPHSQLLARDDLALADKLTELERL